MATLFDANEGEILAAINEVLMTTNETLNLLSVCASSEKMFQDKGSYVFAKILINLLEFKNIKGRLVVRYNKGYSIKDCLVLTESGCLFNCTGQIVTLEEYFEPTEEDLRELNEEFTVKEYLRKYFNTDIISSFANLDMLIHIMLFWNLT